MSSASDRIMVGRGTEIARLHEALQAVLAGRGGQVWVEGEPGIGKSALLAAGLAGAAEAGCQVYWAAADPRGQHFPLRAVADCLRMTDRSDDPERRGIVELLRGGGGAGAASTDVIPAAIERLLALVDRLCGRPTLLVLDDLQWADDASIVVWHQLSRTVGQLPLLLVAACRPSPARTEVGLLYRHAVAQGSAVIRLEPLPPEPVAELARQLLGAGTVGPRLRDAVAEAGGNPLYMRELIAALTRERKLRQSAGETELVGAAAGVPASLAAVISDRLAAVSAGTLDVLRAAAILGADFRVPDLTVVLGRSAVDVAPAVAEAMAAEVLHEAGPRLAFRHPLFHQVLYDGTPAEARVDLHRQAASALAAAGAPADRVAEQLLSALPAPGTDGPVDRWVPAWLAGPGLALSYGSPQLAADLFGRAVQNAPADDPRREDLQAALVTVLVSIGRREEAVRLAEEVLATTRDPARVAELSFLLARALHLLMRYERARAVIGDALRAGGDHGAWTLRLRALLPVVTAQGGGGFDQEPLARKAFAAADRAGDRYAAGLASDALAMSLYSRGDLAGALAVLERTVAMLGDDPETTALTLTAMVNRAGTLYTLDRLADADQATREYLTAGERHAGPNPFAGMRCSAASFYYQIGQWDDALAELEAVANSGFPLSPRNRMVLHGVGALIAAHRDDEARATAHLTAVDDQHDRAGLAAVYGYVLTLARSVLTERAGQPELALSLLGRPDSVAADHCWDTLPWMTRLALATGDLDTARAAADRAAAEQAASGTGTLVALAGHCGGLVDGDPGRLLAAAETYRGVGRRFDLAQVQEDAAVLLADRGDRTAARAAYTEAVALYVALGARWDLRRADARMRPHHIRPGRRLVRPATGWEALTPSERKVAGLVAEGLANPDIAGRLFLSRRTVEVHVSHILAKLDARSRIEIARAAATAPAAAG